ncbi:hypothetical protein HanRHA438_Chr08g0353681 [Helianthus annuus]|nr:hypothetical protein HanIR_Chr08g0369511 [Helianthus annuus]KAJ0898158.1 hypothetical protein HanRHA438_Chr08g0353681 [Helianthus annuus]
MTFNHEGGICSPENLHLTKDLTAHHWIAVGVDHLERENIQCFLVNHFVDGAAVSVSENLNRLVFGCGGGGCGGGGGGREPGPPFG